MNLEHNSFAKGIVQAILDCLKKLVLGEKLRRMPLFYYVAYILFHEKLLCLRLYTAYKAHALFVAAGKLYFQSWMQRRAKLFLRKRPGHAQ